MEKQTIEKVVVEGREFEQTELIRQSRVHTWIGACAILTILALVSGLSAIKN